MLETILMNSGGLILLIVYGSHNELYENKTKSKVLRLILSATNALWLFSIVLAILGDTDTVLRVISILFAIAYPCGIAAWAIKARRTTSSSDDTDDTSDTY